jgi:hypothetical protein
MVLNNVIKDQRLADYKVSKWIKGGGSRSEQWRNRGQPKTNVKN